MKSGHQPVSCLALLQLAESPIGLQMGGFNNKLKDQPVAWN